MLHENLCCEHIYLFINVNDGFVKGFPHSGFENRKDVEYCLVNFQLCAMDTKTTVLLSVLV
jgi:hypothetical protein